MRPITAAGIEVTGSILGNDWEVAVSGLGSLAEIQSLSLDALYGIFERYSGNLASLAKSSLLDVELPFIDGTTLGDVLDFTSEPEDDVLRKLGPIGDLLGFSGPVTATAADKADGISIDIPPVDLSDMPLPAQFKLFLTANGTLAELNLTNQYQGHEIASLADLVGAISDAIAASPLAPIVTVASATVDAGLATEHQVIRLAAVATNDDDAHASITLRAPSTSFDDVVSFAQIFGDALGLGSDISDVARLPRPRSASLTIRWRIISRGISAISPSFPSSR